MTLNVGIILTICTGVIILYALEKHKNKKLKRGMVELLSIHNETRKQRDELMGLLTQNMTDEKALISKFNNTLGKIKEKTNDNAR